MRFRTCPTWKSNRERPIPWLAVYKRELGQYFRSPIAYGVAFAILFFLGLLFNGYIAQAVAANASGQSQIPADSTYAPGLLTFLTFLIAPLLTMRLLAEESREGTLEVLMTMPMNEVAVHHRQVSGGLDVLHRPAADHAESTT